MNEQLKLFINLQEIDSTILSIAEKIEVLPEKLVKNKAILKEAQASFDKTKSRYEELSAKKKRQEGELEEIEETVGKLKAKGSEIKTNKQYEAHLLEIKSFDNKKYQREEDILATMETLDSLAKDLKKEEGKIKKAEESYEQEVMVLDKERNKLHSEMKMYKAKRKDLAGKLDEEFYEEYMRLIKSAGGLAVVQTQDEVCLGCNTNIPPQLYNDIKSSKDVFTCYHCYRFLYHLSPNESPGAGKK